MRSAPRKRFSRILLLSNKDVSVEHQAASGQEPSVMNGVVITITATNAGTVVGRFPILSPFQPGTQRLTTKRHVLSSCLRRRQGAPVRPGGGRAWSLFCRTGPSPTSRFPVAVWSCETSHLILAHVSAGQDCRQGSASGFTDVPGGTQLVGGLSGGPKMVALMPGPLAGMTGRMGSAGACQPDHQCVAGPA